MKHDYNLGRLSSHISSLSDKSWNQHQKQCFTDKLHVSTEEKLHVPVDMSLNSIWLAVRALGY